MYRNRTLSSQNLDFDFEETTRNISNYFGNLEKLKWELARINAEKGLTANYDFSEEYKKQPYMPFGKDAFHLSAREFKEEELKQYISGYYWAKSILSEEERIYIAEYFINGKYETELIDLLGFDTIDSREYRQLKRSAVYKFADFLNLIVERGEPIKNE